MNRLINGILYSVPLYNTCLNSFNISSYFSGRIIISSTFFQFSSGTCFDFNILSAILFPINLFVASVALWTTFQKQFLEHLVLF